MKNIVFRTDRQNTLSPALKELFSEIYQLEFRKSVTSVSILADRYHSSVKFSIAISNLLKRHLISRSMADIYAARYAQETNHSGKAA